MKIPREVTDSILKTKFGKSQHDKKTWFLRPNFNLLGMQGNETKNV